ncbi:MAG: hypothetical protein KJT01_16775, partial [Gemmatimonadetes bacterium]|nr:hypothetical protein [Gemmatimonadota bacterium]
MSPTCSSVRAPRRDRDLAPRPRAHHLTSVLLGVALLAAAAPPPAPLTAQPAAPRPVPPRAIRRDVPLPNGIRRALAAGTRDSTGRPGPRYWQLRTDYAIDVALDPGTQRLTGTARITV